MRRGRPELPELSDDTAREFREVVKRRLRYKKLSRDLIVRSLGGDYGERSRRWLDGALSPSVPLAIDTAIEVALRLSRLRVRLSDRLLTKIYAERLRPVALVFPGEGLALAKMLAGEVARMVGVGKGKFSRVQEAFHRIFKEYERFNEGWVGREFMGFVRSRIGGDENDFRLFMQLSQTPLAIRGDSLKTYSIAGFIEREFVHTHSTGRKRVTTKVKR